jgi:hypothetical protein
MKQWLFEQKLGDVYNGVEDSAVLTFNMVSKDVGKSPPMADPAVDCLMPCSNIRLHLVIKIVCCPVGVSK